MNYRITRMGSARIPTRYGEFQLYIYSDNQDDKEYLALVRGSVSGQRAVLTRVHSECFTGEVMSSLRCDCREQLELAIERIAEAKALQVLFVGSVIRRKGLHVLLNALGDLSQETIQLSIVGNVDVDKKYARAIYRQIADRQLTDVRFLGELEGEDLAAVMTQSDVLAMPSQYEGFEMVYLEGMGFGLPALASANGAAREIVRDGGNGYLVAPDDVLGLANRLDNLSRDRTLLARLSLAARSSFLAFPGWNHTLSLIRQKLVSGYFRE